MPTNPENFNNAGSEIEDLKKSLLAKDAIIKEQEEKIREQETEIERLAEDLEGVSGILEGKLEQFKLDPVTSLESRNFFMGRVDNVLNHSFGLSMGENLKEDEWQELIKKTSENEQKMKELADIHLAFGDVSFLSVANRGGRHDQGDKALQDVAKGLKERTVGAGRLSGDEYAVIIKGNDEEVDKKILEIENSVNNMEVVPNLKKNKLRLNIDFGTAGLDEVVKVFSRFELDKLEKRSAPRELKRELGDIWLGIADKRSSLKKAELRISLLMDRQKSGDLPLSELVKGAYNINPETIDLFIQREKGGEKREKIIRDFIVEQEEKGIAYEESDYLRQRAELIWETVRNF